MSETIDQAHADAAPMVSQINATEDCSLRWLRSLPDYQQGRSHIFKARTALEWFVRLHRDRLIEAGAMLFLTGQWWIHELRFDAFVLAVGKAAAADRRRLQETAEAGQ